jgi:hypothetical protein
MNRRNIALLRCLLVREMDFLESLFEKTKEKKVTLSQVRALVRLSHRPFGEIIGLT